MLTMDAVALEATGVGVDEAQESEILGTLDRQSKEWLGMSGAEFLTEWRAGRFVASDEPRIARLISTALLLS